MPLDPSIFLQGAALRQKNDEQLLASLQSTQDNALKRKALEVEQSKAGLDLDKLFTPVAVKMSMGQQLSPEEMGVAKAYDMVNTAKLAQDASGNYRRVNASIFAGGNQIPSSTPQPGGDLAGVPNNVVNQVDNLPMDSGLNIDMFRQPIPDKVNGVIPMASKDAVNSVGINPDSFLGGQTLPGIETNNMRVNVVEKAKDLYPDNPNAQQKYIEGNASKQAEADVTKGSASLNKDKFQQSLNKMAADIVDLSTKRGNNPIVSYAGATSAGQAAGRMTADDSQTIRDKIIMNRDQLLPQIIGATGAGSKMFDSNAERKGFLESIYNPLATDEANLENLKNLSRQYGTGDLVVPESQPQSGQFREGQTATGPNGVKAIFKGGSWQPL